MKVNEFLKSLNGVLKLELPEEVLTKLDVDLPDGFETKFSETYLTRERAKSDDEIITEITKKSNKTALTAIDEQIKDLLPFVSEEDRTKINSVFSTKEKVALLKPAIDNAMKNAKGKVTDADIRKVEEEWQAKYQGVIEMSKKEKAELAEQMQQKNFEFDITNKLGGYKLSESFATLRPHLTQMALLNLKEKGYKYERENGGYAVRQEKDGVLRDVFNGENKVTLENLLDSFIDPFVQKSNGNGNQGAAGAGQEQQKVIKLDSNASLRDMMLAQAQAAQK